MRKIFFRQLLIIGLALVVMSGVCPAQQRSPYIPYKEGASMAPDFTLKDLQGKPFRLASQRGKIVMLFFGATWCPYCRAEIPSYKEINEKYTPRGLVFIYINIMEPRGKVARFAQSNNLTYRVLVDEDGGVAQSYEIMGVPTIVIINADGRITDVKNLTKQLNMNKLFPVKNN